MRLIHAHVLEGLRQIEPGTVHTCVTSPPYWGLRNYGTPPVKWPRMRYKPIAGMRDTVLPAWEGEMGQEPTLEMFVGHIVLVFRAVSRVLRDDGTLWVNMGDSYCAGLRMDTPGATCSSLKPKDMMGQPWRCALALQADGWFLRSDIIWSKPNPMPECAKDRPTKAHEHIFLLSKSDRYFYDADAIRELAESESGDREDYRGGGDYAQHNTLMENRRVPTGWDTSGGRHGAVHKEGRTSKKNGKNMGRNQGQARDATRKTNREGRDMATVGTSGTRNKRDVWEVATFPFKAAHYATYPPELIRPCIRAGAPPGGIVLDCFAGSGTTGMVSIEEGREPILIELLADNLPLIEERCTVTRALPLFTEPAPPAAPAESTPDLFPEPEPAPANDPIH